MPVTLSVSQVRQALFRADGDPKGDGQPTTALLGRWFHEGLAFLLHPEGPLAQLGEVEPDLDAWKQTLVHAMYDRFVGPRLTREQLRLHGAVPEVLAFWQAMQAACAWVAELSWKLRSTRASQAGAVRPWQTAAECFTMEEPLVWELHEPGWSDRVRLVGIADAVVRLAGTSAWCVLEFKLGQTSPTADLGQACLYHRMLSAAQTDAEPGTLAMVSFQPERHEQLFATSELDAATQRLVELIGQLAGVSLREKGADKGDCPPPPGVSQSQSPRKGDCPLYPPPFLTQPTDEHLELGRNLVKTWAEYGVTVALEKPVIAGPTFIRFPITLGTGTKVRAVEKAAPELQVRLQLKAEPFITREDGQLVIDVQRPDRQTVSFDDIRAKLPPRSRPGGSMLPVGVNLFRELVCADLSRPEHAHILVAGTTGSGKSEWLRLAIAGLIAANTPDTLRLVIIDPKRNAFHALRRSPYLWKPIVYPEDQPAAEVLAELAEEMDRRYRTADGADTFQQMCDAAAGPLPRIVCVCDEYRDLISRNRGERKLIEEQICRLGAKARAAGIHLILATQEPSRDTIKGPLDSNIPARVGLKMGKPTESRMLLNESGAEKLLGHGDLLFKDIGTPQRLQAPLLSDANRAELFG